MFQQIFVIANFVLESFLHIWPYLLITIPIAVAVRMSGASTYINAAFQTRPLVAILLATAVGAFSPFCSCSVIPVVAALLIGGVPLAPVMSFWIASPSMDPEIFFLSVPLLGWELAVWRLVGILGLSLSAGLVTHWLMQRGWLGQQMLKTRRPASVQSSSTLLKTGWQRFKRNLIVSSAFGFVSGRVSPAAETACCSSADLGRVDYWQPIPVTSSASTSSCAAGLTGEAATGGRCAVNQPASFRRRLLSESWNATLMVAKFMALAFVLEALVILYLPAGWIAGLLGRQSPWAIVMAAGLGVPVYTTELTALPLISGLLAQGMNPAAALAFLIAGPTTTLPAMAAVWGLVTRRVFALYLSFSLVGAITLGYLYTLVEGLF